MPNLPEWMRRDALDLNVQGYAGWGLAPNGDSSTSSRAAIQAAIDAASALAAARGLDRVRLGGFGLATYVISNTLFLRPRVHLDLGEARIIAKAGAGSILLRAGNPATGIGASSFADGYGNMKVSGGTFDPNQITPASGGNLIELWFCDGIELDGVVVLLNTLPAYDTWAFSVGGTHGRITNCQALGGARLSQDGFHIVQSSKGFTVTDNYSESGDDAYAMGGVADARLTANPVPVRNVQGHNNIARAEKGHAVRVYVPAVGAGANWENSGHDFAVSGRSGTSRNGGVRLDDVSGNKLIQNVKVTVGLTIGEGTHDGTSPFGVSMESTQDCEVRGTIVAASAGFKRYDLRNALRPKIDVRGGGYTLSDFESNVTKSIRGGVPGRRGFLIAPSMPYRPTPTALTASTSQRRYSRFVADRDRRIASMVFWVTAPGATDDTFDVGIVTKDRATILGSSGAKTSASGGLTGGGLNTTGRKEVTLATPVDIEAGEEYIAFFAASSGATPATIVQADIGSVFVGQVTGTAASAGEGGLENAAVPVVLPVAISSGTGVPPMLVLMEP